VQTQELTPVFRLRVAQGSLFAALGYDNVNRRASLAYSNGTTTSYAYDLASRLTSITHNGLSGLIEALTYTYDSAGNRASLTRANGTASLLPAAVASAAYDPANEQTSFAGATLTYDNNGNLTNDGTNTYVWDARNRLIGISGGATATFAYDPLGRRVSKTINGTSTQFAYDGNDIAAEIGGGAVGANYLRSLNIDEPFIRQAATGNEHYHTDALGSSLALSDITGASIATYGYEPFGKTTATGNSSNALQFTGREEDGTGLYYYRARHYSQMLGRFLSEDPLEFQGEDVNLYAYVLNDPISYRDPLGLVSPTVVAGAGLGALFGGISAATNASAANIHNTNPLAFVGIVGTGIVAGAGQGAALGAGLVNPALIGSFVSLVNNVGVQLWVGGPLSAGSAAGAAIGGGIGSSLRQIAKAGLASVRQIPPFAASIMGNAISTAPVAVFPFAFSQIGKKLCNQ
jgi:RHS repeat-associated protein